jgi:hypothetical protein
LTVAHHQQPASYWEGGHYELNLSFDTLRDRQWQRLVEAVWEQPLVYGPLAARYTPGGDLADVVPVQVPPPTATLTQHGQMKIGAAVIGFDVQATRSLFECISVLIPIGMFEGAEAGLPATFRDLDVALREMALHLYGIIPFRIAAIGYERGCQLPAELSSNPELLAGFASAGNALVQEDVLRLFHLDLSPFEQVRPNLRWLPQG